MSLFARAIFGCVFCLLQTIFICKMTRTRRTHHRRKVEWWIVIFLKVSSKWWNGIFKSITSIVQSLGCGTPSALLRKDTLKLFWPSGQRSFKDTWSRPFCEMRIRITSCGWAVPGSAQLKLATHQVLLNMLQCAYYINPYYKIFSFICYFFLKFNKLGP